MRRDPALHITRSNLIKVLASVGISITESKANDIFKKAKSSQIRNRYQVVATVKQTKQLKKLQETDIDTAEVFNSILWSVRTELNHRFVAIIKPGDSAYATLKEITADAQAFSEMFSFGSRQEGYKAYIKLGLQLIGKNYSLNKFKFYKERLFTAYESFKEIEEDASSDNTAEFYAIWGEKMLEYASLTKDIKDTLDYIHILRARIEADANEADYTDWIVAQFEGLAFLEVIPELSQFYGDNARGRYEKYVLTLAKKIPDGLPTAFTDDAQATYFKRIRKGLNDNKDRKRT